MTASICIRYIQFLQSSTLCLAGFLIVLSVDGAQCRFARCMSHCKNSLESEPSKSHGHFEYASIRL